MLETLESQHSYKNVQTPHQRQELENYEVAHFRLLSDSIIFRMVNHKLKVVVKFGNN